MPNGVNGTQLLPRIIAVLVAIMASDSSAARAENLFGIQLDPETAMPARSGPAGAHNARAAEHIAAFVAPWAAHPAVRFMFVASRDDLCSETSCNPDERLWQAARGAMALLQDAARKRGAPLPFDLVSREAIEDSLPVAARRPRQSSSRRTLELVAWVQQGREPAADCPWQVEVSDPTYPRVVTQHGQGRIVLTTGLDVPIGREASIILSPRSARTPAALVIWENDRSEIRRGSPDAGQAGTRVTLGVPASAVRVHIVPAGFPDLDRFYRALGDTFVAQVPPPPIELRKPVRSASKGIGDNPVAVAGGTIAAPATTAAYCTFSFFHLWG